MRHQGATSMPSLNREFGPDSGQPWPDPDCRPRTNQERCGLFLTVRSCRHRSAALDLSLQHADESIRHRRPVPAGEKCRAPLTLAEGAEQFARPGQIIERDAIADQFLMPAVVAKFDEAI